MYNSKIKLNANRNISIYKFDNMNVVFLLPDDALWVKSTITGLWLYTKLKERSMTMAELLSEASNKFNLQIETIEPAISSFISELHNHGIIYIDDKLGSTQLPLNTKNEPFKQVWINLTNHCNLHCSHCFLPDVSYSEKSHMSIELATKIIDEAADLGISHLTFSGGEPSLHPKLSDIIGYAKNKNQFILKLITNGTTQGKIFFNEVIPLFDDIQISVDGLDKETNDQIRGKGIYEKIEAFMDKVKKNDHKLRVGISFTPLPENLEDIPELYKLTSKLKPDYLNITKPKLPGDVTNEYSHDIVSNEYFKEVLNNYDKFLFNMASIKREIRSLKKYSKAFEVGIDIDFDPANSMLKMLKMERCGAGILTICINQNGDTFPCVALCSKVDSFGNANYMPLKKIMDDMRTYMTNIFSVDNDEKCRVCDFRYFCGGGCRANKQLSSRDILCETLKERYTSLLENLMGPTSKANNDSTFY